MWSYPNSAISRISAITDSDDRARKRSPKTGLWQNSQRNGQPRLAISGVVASFQCRRQYWMYWRLGEGGAPPRRFPEPFEGA